MVAAINLNIFNKHCRRVKMANISQMVNVLQALILTDKEKMILTPTYHVFDLYKVHQDAVLLPFEITCEEYTFDGKSLPALTGTASIDSSRIIHVSIANINPQKAIRVPCRLQGAAIRKVSGRILTSEKMQDHNTFDRPDNVVVRDFTQFKQNKDEIIIEMPSKSIVTLEIR